MKPQTSTRSRLERHGPRTSMALAAIVGMCGYGWLAGLMAVAGLLYSWRCFRGLMS